MGFVFDDEVSRLGVNYFARVSGGPSNQRLMSGQQNGGPVQWECEPGGSFKPPKQRHLRSFTQATARATSSTSTTTSSSSFSSSKHPPTKHTTPHKRSQEFFESPNMFRFVSHKYNSSQLKREKLLTDKTGVVQSYSTRLST